MPIAPVIIAGAIGAAGSAYASSQANKAANKGIAAQERANEQTLALQQQTLQQSQQNNAPFMQAGYGALGQLAQQFGLGQIPGPSGGGATPGTPAGGATPSSQYDVAAYLQQNPDVAAARPQIEAQGVIGPGKQWATFEDWVAREHIPGAMAAGEQRAYPTAQAQQPQQPGAAQPGQGQNYGPTLPERQTYTRPSMPSLSAESYRESPGYQNRLKQAGRATNAQFAARGILGSGAAAEEFGKRMQNIADEDYDSWVNQTLGVYDRQANEFNQDRSFGTGVYDADRNYLTNRFDTNVNDLFKLTGLGQSAANNQGSAQSNYAANVGNQNQSFANTLSDAYGQKAANNASAINNIAGIGQNLLTNWQSKSSAGGGGNSLTNWSQNWGGGS